MVTISESFIIKILNRSENESPKNRRTFREAFILKSSPFSLIQNVSRDFIQPETALYITKITEKWRTNIHNELHLNKITRKISLISSGILLKYVKNKNSNKVHSFY
jgi:hypothetical protein